MIKLVILVISALSLLSACERNKSEMKASDLFLQEPISFVYKKHQYIRFQRYSNIHDPDCKYCKTRSK